MNAVETKGLGKIYGRDENAVRALQNVTFSLKQGEFAALCGMSGSGKTTLLNLLGGLDTPTEGDILIRGHSLAGMSSARRTVFRRRNIGFVFQNYSLMPVLNVYDNVALPLSFDKGRHMDHAYIRELLEGLGLWEKREKLPEELSGGQQQRAAIARALANRPAVLLADEPTGNLDSATAADVIGLLKASSRKYSQTVLMVTHNEVIAQSCDRVFRIEDGRLCPEGGMFL